MPPKKGGVPLPGPAGSSGDAKVGAGKGHDVVEAVVASVGTCVEDMDEVDDEGIVVLDRISIANGQSKVFVVKHYNLRATRVAHGQVGLVF